MLCGSTDWEGDSLAQPRHRTKPLVRPTGWALPQLPVREMWECEPRLAEQAHVALVGAQDVEPDSNQRRLSRAVRPEQPEHLAGLDVE